MTERNFPLSPAAERAMDLLHRAGYEAFAVGGCVRDALLGQTPKDYDITTSALPTETKAVFAGFHLIETGLKHGTVTVLIDGEPLEITTYRVDGGYPDSRHPDGVTFTRSLREDAARRDFTVNAMAYDREHGVQDFFGGEADLKGKTLRCVGDADRRFTEDALRILRCLRFASVLGFSIEKETENAARRHKELLTKISAERVAVELGKLLCGSGAGKILRRYPDILGVVLPELLPMVGYDQRNEHHCYDLLTHTAVVVDSVPPVLPLRLAALFHDMGKPRCFSMGEDGQGHFYGHAHLSGEMAENICRRLRLSNDLRERVVTLVRCHDTVIEEDSRLIRRRLNRLGEENFFALLDLQRGDTMGLAPAYRDRLPRFDRVEALARELLAGEGCLTLRDLAVNGHDLLALGCRGKAVGQGLTYLLEGVLEERFPNEREALFTALTKKFSETPAEMGEKTTENPCNTKENEDF